MVLGREAMVEIVGTGSSAPEKVLTNFDLEKMVDTSDEWIRTRTGIRERRVADKETATSDMAAQAARRALEDAGMGAEELEMIIVGTVTPDMNFPSTACLVQDKIGAKRAAVLDISAGCSGFIYGLSLARGLIDIGEYSTVLVIGAETLTKILDWEDRNTCVLFGDGAGAAILHTGDKGRGILATYLGGDGSLGTLLALPAGGSRLPASHQTVEERLHYIKMAGNEVFKSAVRAMGNSAIVALEKAGLSNQDVDLLIPHQANLRIIQATAKRIDLPMEKVYVNLDRYGNTSAASIPIALDEARRSGLIKKGDISLLVAFGAGFTWGSVVIKW